MLASVRGLKSLVHDAVDLTVDLVEEGHASAARGAARILALFAPGPGPAALVEGVRLITSAPTLQAIRTTNQLVRWLGDVGLDAAVAARLLPLGAAAAPVPLRSDITGTGAWRADAALGALNGLVGDYLHRSGNALDLGFRLRCGDAYLEGLDEDAPWPAPWPAPGAPRRVAVLVHGLATTEWSWCWDAATALGDASATFGTLLQRDLGFSPLYARYNTGRRVADNGRLLAERLERLCAAQPVPIEEILLIGHSMGGLVARSACRQGRAAGHRWVRAVSRVVCLGTPHRGAPLEKLGHLLTTVLGGIDHPGARVPAELLRRRSAGIRDLRHGAMDDGGEGEGEAGPRSAFASATLTRDPAHPLGWLLGDALVRVSSAAGPGAGEHGESRCFGGVAHHQLQSHRDVYAWLRALRG